MRKNTSAIAVLVGLFLVIVLLNFIFISGEGETQEREETGGRSSYRSTPFGTLAFYTLLEESGYPVERLQVPLTDLSAREDISTLVVISPPAHLNPSAEEFKSLTEWIENGGWVVIIDREISVEFPDTSIDTSRTFGASREVRRAQPSIYTRGVEKTELSDFATRVKVQSPTVTYHIGDDRGAILADTSVGEGRIILLTDPYVVANNGIGKADNVRLALNLFADPERPYGVIAFDEYHHGYGSPRSEGTIAYFRGTPIPWMMAQAALIAALAIYTYGRRFARPLPVRREKRTTNLEFVSSMANIIRLARASDLAMKNIYREFHKRLCRYAGVPPTTDNDRLAQAAARRSRIGEDELRGLLSRCDYVSQGGKVSEAELLNLARRIRDIETDLRL